MTITFNTEAGEFYESLKNVILEVVARKIRLFAVLKEQPDVIQRREALSAVLTLFSMSDSAISSRGFEDGKLRGNIESMIKEFYDTTGNAEVIGVPPTVLAMETLEDLAYSIKPRFNLDDLINFVRDQPLRPQDKEMLEAAVIENEDPLIFIIAAIAMVIKSEMLLVDVVEASSGKKKSSD